jgi:transcriptional regulator with XRE-family HTH domain
VGMDASETKLAARIGASIRSNRGRLKWSQAVLAEQLGTSVEYVSLLERGERLPSLGLLLRLSKALEVRVGVLLDEPSTEPDRDPAVALLRAIPAAAQPAVLGMLRGVLAAYRRPRR